MGPAGRRVAYLEEYAEHHRLRIRTGAEVARVERAGADDADGWVVRLADGEELRADDVVVATGYNHTPRVPRWTGDEDFAGEIVHASDYRNGRPWAGRRALVVGIGNTGAEIATDLADHGAQPVWSAVRTAPYILARDRGPVLTATLTGVLVRHLPPRLVDLLQDRVLARDLPDLTEHGLARPSGGIYSQVLKGTIPVQDVGIVAAIRAGRVRPVAAPARFGPDHVELVDGTRVDPDVVVVAAGYERGLQPLVGHLGVLDESGSPLVGGGREALPGLWFTGFTNPISGMSRELRIDAGRIARRVARRHTRSDRAA